MGVRVGVSITVQYRVQYSMFDLGTQDYSVQTIPNIIVSLHKPATP
jgi:hypothetical protein